MLHSQFSPLIRPFTLAVLAAAALSACGGGSSGDAAMTAASLSGGGGAVGLTSVSATSASSSAESSNASSSADTAADAGTGGSDDAMMTIERYRSRTSTTTSDSTSTSTSGGTTGSATTSSALATVTLGNLPAATTTVTSASITYTSSPGTVYCRRDSYLPIVCPNPFVLGSVVPLATGTHTVDYYLDSGAGIDTTKPTRSYAWAIASTTTAATTSTATTNSTSSTTTSTSGTTSTTGTTSSASLLPKLAATNWEGNGYDGSYSGQTITGSDGLARVQTLSDGSYLMRTVNGDVKTWSSNRSEFSWSGQQNLQKGVDYWYAFAFKPMEWEPDSGGGRQIFWQLQQVPDSGASGCTGPTLEFQAAGDAFVINKNTSTGGAFTCETVSSAANTVPAVGKWTKFVVHFRPGYLASQNPILEVWRDGVKIITHTAINSSPNSKGEYSKMGVYKWDNTWGSTNSRAANYSPLYFGQGADLKANADAAVAAF